MKAKYAKKVLPGEETQRGGTERMRERRREKERNGAFGSTRVKKCSEWKLLARDRAHNERNVYLNGAPLCGDARFFARDGFCFSELYSTNESLRFDIIARHLIGTI